MASDDPSRLTPQELGALLARKAKRVSKPCAQCGVEMQDVTVRREFCSPKCRQKHWLRRLYGLKPGQSMPYMPHVRPKPGPGRPARASDDGPSE